MLDLKSDKTPSDMEVTDWLKTFYTENIISDDKLFFRRRTDFQFPLHIQFSDINISKSE